MHTDPEGINMRKSLVSTLIYALGNAIGLALAALLLPGFKIGVTAFVVAVLIFSGLQLILKPLIIKLSKKAIKRLLPFEIEELRIWLLEFTANKPELYVSLAILKS